MPTASSTSRTAAQIQERVNCACAGSQSAAQLSEKAIQAKIDEALSAKFESYCGKFEQKVTDLV